MVWPVQRQVPQFLSQPPHGYILRTYQPGDESGFFQLMALAGWPDWDAERLKPWLYRILPRGWFMAVDQESDEIMATSMATHDPTWQVPFCAELGWVALKNLSPIGIDSHCRFGALAAALAGDLQSAELAVYSG
jgi:hypothetical protein